MHGDVSATDIGPPAPYGRDVALLRGSPSGTDPDALLPTPHDRRSVAPDLSRGAMLLFIALANVVGYLHRAPTRHGYRPVDGTSLDRAANVVVHLLVSERSYPMFAILFGYGLATMARRMSERGVGLQQVRLVLARRGLWLVVLGLAHAALLFDGDILAAYGASSLVALFLLNRRLEVILRWMVPSLLTMTLAFVVSAVDMSTTDPPEVHGDYLASALERLLSVGANALLVGVAVPFLFLILGGVLVSRAGWLDRPWEHRRTLWRVALGGLGVNLVGGLPYALVVGEVWSPSRPVAVFLAVMHRWSGLAMGLAYICLFALLAARYAPGAGRAAPPRAVRAVSAVGERSLTCYLLQSVMFAPLLSAWGAGLGARIGTAQAYALALGVWGVTLLVAVLLAAGGHRGPFEVLLRRLTYGRRPPATPAASPRPTPAL